MGRSARRVLGALTAALVLLIAAPVGAQDPEFPPERDPFVEEDLFAPPARAPSAERPYAVGPIDGPVRAEVEGLRPEEQQRRLHVVRASEVRRAFDQWAVMFWVPLVTLLSAAALLAWQCLLLTTFPAAVDRTREAIERRSLLSVALGAPNMCGLLLVSGLGAAIEGPGLLLTMLAGVVFLGLVLVGFAAKAQAIGLRLLGPEHAGRRLATLSLGWVVMVGVAIVPFVGWVVLAWWTLGGIGAVMLAVLSRVARSAAPPPAGGGTPAAKF